MKKLELSKEVICFCFCFLLPNLHSEEEKELEAKYLRSFPGI